MSIVQKKKNVKSWKQIKDEVYGKRGTSRREKLERDARAFTLGLQLRNARISKNMTQDELGDLLQKKRSFISRIENDGSNLTLKTLIEIVEKGLGGKVHISISFS